MFLVTIDNHALSRLKRVEKIMSGELQAKTIEFLISLQNLHATEGQQQSLIYSAGLDAELQARIPFGTPSAQFVPLVVSTALDYGTLNDGRDALVAVLTAAKQSVGKDKKEECDKLIDAWQKYHEELAASKAQAQPASQAQSASPETQQPIKRMTPENAFIPGYVYDIFVSHAEVDTPWVTACIQGVHSRLAKSLGEETRVAIWKSEHKSISASMLDDIGKTALLVIVLSYAYIDSKRCENEWKRFLQSLQEQGKTPFKRVFVVELEKLEAIEIFQDLRGLERHRRFWERDKQSGGIRTLTATEAMASADCKHNSYAEQLQDLSMTLAHELLSLKNPHEHTPSETEASASKAEVFLAEVTDDLYWEREKVRRSLEQAGIRVLPETNECSEMAYLSNPQACKTALEQHLEHCFVFVQLLSDAAGVAPNGQPTYNRFQYDRAYTAGKRILQWCPPSLVIDTVKNTDQKQLLTGTTLLKTSLEEFKQKVQRTLTENRQRSNLGGKFVFINADSVDYALAEKVKAFMESYHIGWAFPEEQSNVLKELEQYVEFCDGIIVVYGQANPFWTKKQVIYCNSMLFRREQPLKACLAVLDGPPQEKTPLKVGFPDVPIINCREGVCEEKLKTFLENLN